jgi:hypothetical protein
LINGLSRIIRRVFYDEVLLELVMHEINHIAGYSIYNFFIHEYAGLPLTSLSQLDVGLPEMASTAVYSLQTALQPDNAYGWVA